MLKPPEIQNYVSILDKARQPVILVHMIGDTSFLSLRGARSLAYARNRLRNLRSHLSLREAVGDEAI
jgi:hypothetical protein